MPVLDAWLDSVFAIHCPVWTTQLYSWLWRPILCLRGMSIRHGQEMLGHTQIATTQRYTHVSIARLKAVHAATHPAAKLERRERGDLEGL